MDSSASPGGTLPVKPGGLEEQLRNASRSKHYSRHTGDAYALWYRQFDSALPTGLIPYGAA